MTRKRLPESECDLMIAYWQSQQAWVKAYRRLRSAQKKMAQADKLGQKIHSKLIEQGWDLGFSQQHLSLGKFPYSTSTRPQR